MVFQLLNEVEYGQMFMFVYRENENKILGIENFTIKFLTSNNFDCELRFPSVLFFQLDIF